MRKLYSIRISISNDKSSLVPNSAFEGFYKYIANSIFGNGVIDVFFMYLNIPIDTPLKPRWTVLKDQLFSFLKSISETSNNHILLHVEEVLKPTNYYEILSFFNEVKKELNIFEVKSVFYLKDEDYILPFNPMFYKKIGVDGNLVFLNEKGEYTHNENTIKKIPNFLNFHKRIQLTAEDRLRLKLIRRLGHFIKEKDGIHISCQKYFYDGSKCISEITFLLHKYLVSIIDKDKTFGIYFHSPYSKWATNCFLQIHEQLKLEFKNKCFPTILNDEFSNVEQVIFLTDVVVSGKTLRDKYNEIKSINNSVSVIPFCIVDCSSSDPSEMIVKGSTKILNGNSDILLYFLLQKKQEHQNRESETCVMCNSRLDIPKKKFSELEDTPRLSSFEMWSMTIESGLHSEHIIPPGEDKVERFPNLIPDTLNIIRFNGAYLASKFQELLKQNGLIFPISGFVAYPDETNNTLNHYHNLTADEVPSNLFISSLKLIYEYNILPIPRDLIEDIKKDPSLLSSIKEKYREFYSLMLMIKNEPIVIVDEFPRSYRTYEAMRKILTEVEKIPLAYVTFFNFSPDQAKNKVIPPTKHLNFYEFQLD